MIPALLALLFIGIHTEGYQNFQKNSNGVQAYEFELVRECETGLRNSGFSLAPVDAVFFKQANEDGTVNEDVCTD